MKPTVLMLIMACFLALTACNSTKKAAEDMSMGEKMSTGVEEFSLKGNEPYWNIEISGNEIILSQMDKDNIVYPYYQPKDGAFSRIFETSADVNGKTSQLKIIVEKKTCNDSMADMTYDYKATVVKDGKTMKGCGSLK